MSSSTSSSDARDWTRFVVSFFSAWLLIFGLLALALVILDPYDTGRFALWSSVGVPRTGQRTADASRGRDRRFDWAIIGNSRLQLIDPARLGELIKAPVVSLAIPGTGPFEQLAVEGWFARHHVSAPGGLIFGLDDTWCRSQPKKSRNPFPFWLYTADSRDYLANLVRWQSLDMAAGKIALLAGRAKPARADGYDDYEIGRTWRLEDVRRRLTAPPDEDDASPETPADPGGHFPSADDLGRTLRTLSPATIVVLVFTPAQATVLPQPDQTDVIEAVKSCKAAYAAVAQGRANTVFLDFLVADDLTRPIENFWDPVHYRANVARAMEARIAAAIGPTTAHQD